MPRHITVLTLSAVRDGKLYAYVTAETAQKAIDRFGAAVSVDKVIDEHGEQWLVECESQRGERGSFYMHEIACNFGVPVHVQ